MRRHPSHYLSPARANARQGKTPKPAAAAPSHHSNAPNKPESQSILSKIVAHWIDGLPPDPGRACLLLSGHWLKAARHLRFQSTISKFESSRPSQPVPVLATVCDLHPTAPEIRAFLAFDFVSRLPISQSRERNGRKSPALSAKIPVLQRLSAETSSIGTAARERLRMRDRSGTVRAGLRHTRGNASRPMACRCP
jgi:hypothetical protein